MTPGEQCTAWAQLRAWVTWLTDRYELTSEDRLPVCWAQHPGLVEELWALRAWRLEIYGGRQPASAQAARYWHTELRQVLYAATTMYASGCRAGHRSAPRVVFGDAEVHRRWAEANFLAGVPAVDVAAGRAKRGSGWIPAEQMAAAIDVEEAAALPGMDDYVTFAGSWWIPASDGWIEVPALPVPVRDAGTDPWALDGVQEDGDPWRR